MTDITSLGNPRVKRVVRLRASRDRQESGLFPVDGIREILRAYESGFRLDEVFVLSDESQSSGRFDGCSTFARSWRERTASFLESHDPGGKRLPSSGLDFLKRLSSEKTAVWTVSRNVYDKLSFGDRGEGMIALVESKRFSFSDLETILPANPLIAVVEGVEKPGNVGAVFRCADGAGVNALILASPGTDLFNPNTIRASLGTVFRIPTVVANTEQTLKWLLEQKLQIVVALCDHATDYTNPDYTRPTAIVLGSEADGLTPCWSNREFLESSGKAVTIPMRGIADSLNISAAAAILFYEAQRQRAGR